MPTTVTSPITSRARDPGLPTSPGAHSMPGARQDSELTGEKPAGPHPSVQTRGAKPEPGLPVEGRSDDVGGVVANHLVRHRLLTLPRGE
jgi:hypothetical protein